MNVARVFSGLASFPRSSDERVADEEEEKEDIGRAGEAKILAVHLKEASWNRQRDLTLDPVACQAGTLEYSSAIGEMSKVHLLRPFLRQSNCKPRDSSNLIFVFFSISN